MAIRQYRKNVEKFIAIYTNKKLSSVDKLFFHDCKQAIITHFVPAPFLINLNFSRQQLTEDKAKSLIKSDPTYPNDGALFSKTLFRNYKYDLYITPTTEESSNLGYIAYSNNAYYTYYNPKIPETKILAFIDEHEATELAYKIQDSKNNQGEIVSSLPNEYLLLMEYSSSINSLPAELKKLLAPLFCEYFSKFHEIAEYCATPQYKY